MVLLYVILLLLSTSVFSFVQTSEYDALTGSGLYSDDTTLFFDYNGGYKERTSRHEIYLRPYSQLINRWFGSEEEADKHLWNRTKSAIHSTDVVCNLGMAWLLEEVRITLLNKENDLSFEERQIVRDQLELAIKKNVEASGEQCRRMFWQLRKHRSNLDCALGPHTVCEHFSNITSTRSASYSIEGCWDVTEKLFQDIFHVNFRTVPCDNAKVYQDLIYVAQVAKKRNALLVSDENSMQLLLKADLTAAISSPTHLAYLNYIACPDQSDSSDCPHIMKLLERSVCEELTLSLVKDIMKILGNDGSAPNPPRKQSDMQSLMELQTQLTSIMKTVAMPETTLPRLAGEPEDIALTMLKYYLNIVDNTIGKSSEEVWKEMSKGRVNQNLQIVLVNNEEYVDAMSELIFNTMVKFNSTTVDKQTMTLKMMKVQSGDGDKIGFEFGEANIETEFPEDIDSNDLKLYAFHYKSWADLQNESDSSSNTGDANQGKLFIGKGGIVSLSAHSNNTKKSTKVSYKMKFGRRIEEIPSSATLFHRCLSCEFFNTTGKIWEKTGCSVKSVNEDGVTCHCNHTTNFAAFMSPVPINLSLTDAQFYAKQITSYVGSGLSVIALALSLIIFNLVRPTVRNDRLKAHMNLAVALFFVHATQLTVDFAINNNAACLTTAVITHFFLLASFFWMLIEGIFLYLYVVQVFVHSSIEYIRWLFVMGWAIPIVIVGISAGIGISSDTYLDSKETHVYCKEGEMLYPELPRNTGSIYKSCWLSVESGMIWSFIAPAIIIIIINCAILCKVVQVLMKVSSRSNAMMPFKSPLASSGKRSETKESCTYVNKVYPRKEAYGKTKFSSTNCKTATNQSPNIPSDYGSTINEKTVEHIDKDERTGESGIEQSPSRFDSRVPSQAYMYNRPQYKKQERANYSPTTGNHLINDVRAAVKGAMVLLPILGIPWICGIWVGSNFAFLMIFLLINSTQGVVIFVVYCILNGEVRRSVQRHFRLMKLRGTSSRSRAGSTSSLRSLNSRMFWRRKSSTTVSQINNK